MQTSGAAAAAAERRRLAAENAELRRALTAAESAELTRAGEAAELRRRLADVLRSAEADAAPTAEAGVQVQSVRCKGSGFRRRRLADVLRSAEADAAPTAEAGVHSRICTPRFHAIFTQELVPHTVQSGYLPPANPDLCACSPGGPAAAAAAAARRRLAAGCRSAVTRRCAAGRRCWRPALDRAHAPSLAGKPGTERCFLVINPLPIRSGINRDYQKYALLAVPGGAVSDAHERPRS